MSYCPVEKRNLRQTPELTPRCLAYFLTLPLSGLFSGCRDTTLRAPTAPQQGLSPGSWEAKTLPLRELKHRARFPVLVPHGPPAGQELLGRYLVWAERSPPGCADRRHSFRAIALRPGPAPSATR